MKPVNTIPVKPRSRSSDGIQNRLEDLNLQPRPKVVSAIVAPGSGIPDDYTRDGSSSTGRHDSGRSARGGGGRPSNNMRDDASQKSSSENGSGGDEELDLGDEGDVPLWMKAYKIVRANRIGFFLLMVAPIVLALGKEYSPSKEFGALTWKSSVVVECTIVAMMLMINDLPSDLVLIGVNVVLLNSRIISIEQSVQGLSSSSVLSIGILFVVARAMEETGVVESILVAMLGNPKSVREAVLRLGFPVAFLSAFMNNTPIVAMMIPTVQIWSAQTGISASKLLMPLSYAAMLGGMCTLLGTSTNLILQDLAAAGVDPSTDDEGDDDDLITYNITMFSMSAVGVPLMVIGILFMTAFSCLLPSHESQRWSPSGSIEVTVKTASGKTVKLVDVMAGDTITVEALEQLSNYSIGAPNSQVSKPPLMITSELKPKDIEMMHSGVSGDGDGVSMDDATISTSTSLTSADGLPLWASSRDIQPRDENELVEKDPRKKMIAGGLLVTMVTLAAIRPLEMSIFTLSMTASCLLVLTDCITVKQAFEAIKGRVLLSIFATYGLGSALADTGVASLFASALIYIGNLVGPVGLLTMVFLTVSCLSCVVSNQATVILLWPVVSVIDIHGLHIGQFAVILMMGASTSFATPIGYQTNLMIYEPGGYEFIDFARMGAPLTLVLAPFAGLFTYYFV